LLKAAAKPAYLTTYVVRHDQDLLSSDTVNRHLTVPYYEVQSLREMLPIVLSFEITFEHLSENERCISTEVADVDDYVEGNNRYSFAVLGCQTKA
jgi:hypothetical protein